MFLFHVPIDLTYIQTKRSTRAITFLEKNTHKDSRIEFHYKEANSEKALIVATRSDSDGGYKLLDWRQDFAGELYNGDKYYDLAKLRHNIIFNHENVSNNLYDIKIKNNNVIIDLKCNYTLINQLKDFDNFVLDNKLNLKKIKILTALIWLNMSPLHEYPLNEFLFYFGKYNLSLEL